MQQTHFYNMRLRSFASVDSPSVFSTINPCGLLNYVRQFSKISVVFHTLYLRKFFFFFCISDKSNSLSDCSKTF